MNIVDYIPYGRKNAITREQLMMLTGMPDRALRKEIERLRQEGICILNLQDGGGYYRPRPEERSLAEIYMRQQLSRAKSIYKGLKGVREFLKGGGPVAEQNH